MSNSKIKGTILYITSRIAAHPDFHFKMIERLFYLIQQKYCQEHSDRIFKLDFYKDEKNLCPKLDVIIDEMKKDKLLTEIVIKGKFGTLYKLLPTIKNTWVIFTIEEYMTITEVIDEHTLYSNERMLAFIKQTSEWKMSEPKLQIPLL